MRRPVEFAAAVLLLAASALQARESDRQQPMSIEADDADTLLTDDSESVLSGNVRIAQGTLLITAGKATIARAGGDVKRVVLEGQPASMQQENDEGVLMKANARTIDYDVTGENVVLTGNVAVDQGADTLRGERITYDLKNGRLNASGAGTGEAGRIRMTIQPRPKAAEPAEPEGTQP